MFIKSVIIDGFKSYGRRTEINGFDPEFSAITGLNGSGKSNILDSICFVMGIMNLQQVRVASLQELVYKSGQAGVTKATVTIIFDNTDPNQCPMGYGKCREISVTRQIIVGGKNKYLINGKLVQNKKVADLFCSVQLNVNNPSFLIMQGRITKVLNMKPAEILSMIEEAAGTSMYESKREATTKLIEKKDAKVRETNTLLQEEVEPKLEKLRQDKASYEEYLKISREIENLERIFVSFQYLKQKEAIISVEQNVEKLNHRIKVCQEIVSKNNLEVSQIDDACQRLQLHLGNGGVLQQLEKELKDQNSAESASQVTISSFKAVISQEEKKLSDLEKYLKSEENTLEKKQNKMLDFQDRVNTIKEASANCDLSYKNAQIKYDSISKGLSTNEDGESMTLQNQLIKAKERLAEAQTNIKTTDMELKNYFKVLKEKKLRNQKNDDTYVKYKNMHTSLKAVVEKLTHELTETGYASGKLESLLDQKEEYLNEIRQLKQQLNKLEANRYELLYTNPGPDFDRRKFHGMVGKLFRARKQKYYLALMMAGGGNLYAHVTDDDVTSKILLQRGQLQNRTTMIPINKISSHPIRQSVIDCAKNMVGEENVDSALSLIDYDMYYDPVMKFVFGHTLICRDLNIAKRITYDRNIQCRTVTLDGDIVDPEGTLSGGSRPKGPNVIEILAKIVHIEEQIKIRQDQYLNLEQEIRTSEIVAKKYNEITRALDLRQIELNSCKNLLAETDFHQNEQELNELINTVQVLEGNLKTLKETEINFQDKIMKIEKKLSDAQGYRELELKIASEAMESAKNSAEVAKKNWKQHEHNFNTLKLEIEEIRKNINLSKDEYNRLNENICGIRADLDKEKKLNFEIMGIIDKLQKRVEECKDKITSHNKELKSLSVKKTNLQKENDELAIEIVKKENEVSKIQSETKDSKKKLEGLEKNYAWILLDQEFFGKRNTRYDYSKENPVEAGKKMSEMREKKEKMERIVNKRAMTMLEREEEQYQETIRRKKIVEQDKEKIKNIIVKMDEQKREKVESAWAIVDKNFGSIFSSLLHGAEARLNPVKEKNELVGLEIKVGFNGIYKESLSELSGGQRSLVALSLVLAMLKFSPAPLYILDEVDSALDMSHTQNIGNMLHAHFSNSQFIIVSLKDGMFNNANVLFRTKFEEGVSVVSRIVNPKIGGRRI